MDVNVTPNTKWLCHINFDNLRMGKESRFGKLICYTLDHAMKGPIGRIFMYLGVQKGWKNPSHGMW
jgi:hypothetical protein